MNEHILQIRQQRIPTPTTPCPSLPNEPQKLTANWGVWSCYWVPVWFGVTTMTGGTGSMKAIGNTSTGYSASTSGVMSLMPDDIVPTASGKSMKSGYGVKQDVTATLSTDAPTSHITHPQTAFSVFPSSSTKHTYAFCSGCPAAGVPNSPSSPTSSLPITGLCISVRYGSPDSTDYTVFTQVWDTWTPDGMLSINLNDYVSIDGSLYDDWYTNRE